VCLGLGYLGSRPAEGGYVIAARILTAYYFIHFLIILPLLGLIETPRPLPNSISEAVLKKAKAAILLFAVGLGTTLLAGSWSSALAADAPHPPRNKWSFAGVFGKFDQGQLQRGFKVYKEVCQTCHGLNLLSFRNLADPGGQRFLRISVRLTRRRDPSASLTA